MSGGSRALPSHPSLRYLKLEAKRRLAAGEFTSLHEAQATIAREYGRSSWAGLKQDCAGESHALTQVRWLIARFRTADRPGWIAPEAGELRRHVDDRFLAAVPDLAAQLSRATADLRSDLVVISQRTLEASVTIAGMRYFAAVDDEPPHRLIALQCFPLADRITDPRITGPHPPPAQTLGPVPARVPARADRAFAELGLPALVRLGTGWASLLPPALAAQALTVQADGAYRVGLGWLISPDGDTAVHSGVGLEATASLRIRVRDLRTHVVLTSRQIPLDSIDLGETDV